MRSSLTGSHHLYRADLLHQDPHVVVINKPSGVPVHRGWAADPVTAVSLVRRMVKQKLDPVHRLDRGTSGALMFSLDGETTAALQDQFKSCDVHKGYLLLTRGVVPESGHIDHAVPRKPKGERVEARTSYRRLGVALDRYSLVLAHPETGRLHQIRRHFKHLSHPLIGDTAYGEGKENRRFRTEFGLHRLALHSLCLRFTHPHTGARIQIYAPPPDDLRVPLERLGFDPVLWSRAAVLPEEIEA